MELGLYMVLQCLSTVQIYDTKYHTYFYYCKYRNTIVISSLQGTD